MTGASEIFQLAADLAAAPAAITVGAIGALASEIEAAAHDAQSLAPVLTGELRAGIIGESRGLTGEVTSGAGYSAYVEYGTSDTAPQPFMRPAMERREPLLERAWDDVVSGVL